MIKISGAHINIGKMFLASPNSLWDLITDTTQWPQWGPTVKGVRISERYICTGSKGQVLTSVGFWIPFVITDYEHKSFWGWKVASIKATGHRIRPTNRGGCSFYRNAQNGELWN